MSSDLDRLRPTTAEELIAGAALVGNAFPLIGGVASGIALFSVSERRWVRLIEFLRSVEQKLEQLTSISADQEELVAEVLERVVRERSHEKTDSFRNILLNAVTDEGMDYDEVIEMVRLVEQMTPNHIKLLSVLQDPVKADERLGGKVAEQTAAFYMGPHVTFLRPFFPDWGDERLRRAWGDLQRFNILTQDYPTAMGSTFTLEGLSGYVSAFGRTVVSYIIGPDGP